MPVSSRAKPMTTEKRATCSAKKLVFSAVLRAVSLIQRLRRPF
jgi:hypothetical protein